MKALKFCMVTTFYPPYNFGGDGIFVQRLVNALSKDGHTVHVIHDVDAFALNSSNLPEPPISDNPNIIIHSLKGLGVANLLMSHQLGRLVGKKRRQIKAILEQTDFDVIHFHNISLLGGPEILKYGSAIKLCTLHDHWFVCAMHVLWRFDREACNNRTCLRCTLSGHRPPQIWRYTGSVADAVRYVDAFIAPSNFARHSHLANGFPAPIRYLPHFLPEREVTTNNEIQLTSHQRPYFLFVGRLEKIKGVQVLIEQFQKYDAADLLIAGTGIYAPELQQMARGLDRVHFLGRVDYAQLQNLYRHTIAAIIPSLCYETFGLVALEAFAVGTPAIVHNLGALPEIVRDGGGLIYESDAELIEAMEALRTQPDLREKLGNQAYQIFLKKYTEERHLNQYYELINELKELKTANKIC